MENENPIAPKSEKVEKILDALTTPLFGPDLSRPEARPEEGYAAFLDDLKGCNDCGLRDAATQPVPGHGALDAPLMMVGEAPGAEEDRCGIPFSGPAGQLLDRSLAKLGVARSRIYITNVVRYRPPENRMPRSGEIKVCITHLLMEIRIVRPKIIAALGATAAQSLLGTKASLKTLRSRYIDAGAQRIFPMYHPAYALRNLDRDASILAVFETDLRRVCKDAGLME